MNKLFLKQISPAFVGIEEVISLAIGSPTSSKIKQIVDSYKNAGQYLIGCFLKEKLIGVIGFEKIGTKVTIRHISIIKEFQRKGVGVHLINYVIEQFKPHEISAETDEAALNFYKRLGFKYKEIKNKHNRIRYKCDLQLSSKFIIE
jgi:ribosomal protein S18 acetylase RimI-like enzyme